MSVATDGIHCLCPPRFPPGFAPDGRPLPKLFAEQRIEIFEAVSAQLPFAHWQTSQPDDIGMMMLEWLATLLDNLSFYNDLWIREQHLKTAMQEGSLRELAALTGYQPRPNLAAKARLAVISDASAPLVLPAGRGVTSEGSDRHPALGFETTGDAAIDPALNMMTAIPPRDTFFHADFVAIGGAARNLRPDEPVVFTRGDTRVPALLQEIGNEKFPSGESYGELKFDRSVSALEGQSLDDITLWSFTSQSQASGLAGNKLQLAGVHPNFHEGQHVAVVDGASGDLCGSAVVGEVGYQNSIVIDSETRPVLQPVTQLSLDCDIIEGRSYVLFHGPRRGGQLIGAPMTRMTLADFGEKIAVEEKYLGDQTDYQGDFAIVDAENTSVAITARLDVQPQSRRAALVLIAVDTPDMTLKAPLKIYGNFVQVDQGKTVVETLGSANGRRYQSFSLSKKPLTFLRQSNADPAAAIELYVDAVPWRYVPNLYGVGPEDRVFTLRVAADGQAEVILGGLAAPGERNVAARYRFGTTGDNPAAFTIKSPAGRIDGVAKLFNPFAALGGLKGDGTEDLRYVLPARISANDRCVSARDHEVLARDFGALAARARTFWNARRKRAAVEVIAVFDGGFDTGLAGELRDYLLGHAPEGSLIDVVSARPAHRVIALTVRLSADAARGDVERRIEDLYFNEHTGLLAPGRIRIGHAYDRAELLGPLDRIVGVAQVERLSLDGDETAAALPVAADEYLDATLDLEVLR